MARMDRMNLVTHRALGAQLLQAFINAQPVFYVSPLSIDPGVPVRVARPVLLAPGEIFEGTLSISSVGAGLARD